MKADEKGIKVLGWAVHPCMLVGCSIMTPPLSPLSTHLDPRQAPLAMSLSRICGVQKKIRFDAQKADRFSWLRPEVSSTTSACVYVCERVCQSACGHVRVSTCICLWSMSHMVCVCRPKDPGCTNPRESHALEAGAHLLGHQRSGRGDEDDLASGEPPVHSVGAHPS